MHRQKIIDKKDIHDDATNSGQSSEILVENYKIQKLTGDVSVCFFNLLVCFTVITLVYSLNLKYPCLCFFTYMKENYG